MPSAPQMSVEFDVDLPLPPGESLPPEPTQRGAYDKHLAEARALPPDQVLSFRSDDGLVYPNVAWGVRALSASTALIEQLPNTRPDLVTRYLELGLAFLFASRQVQLYSRKLNSNDWAQQRALRQLLLVSLHAASLKGLIDGTVIARIVKGRGHADAAQDGIDLADLARTHAEALSEKVPYTAEDVATLDALSHRVLNRLALDGNLQQAPSPETQDALDLRQRFWTLLNQCAEEVRRVAGFLFGAHAEREVPLLLSRRLLSIRKSSTREQTLDQSDLLDESESFDPTE